MTAATDFSVYQGVFLFLLVTEAALEALELRVEEERAEPAGDMVVGQKLEVELGEFEGHGKLGVQLVDNVEELEEDGGEAGVRAGVVDVAAVIEPMSEGDPLLLDQGLKAVQRSVIRVKTQLGQAGDLTGEVPAVL